MSETRGGEGDPLHMKSRFHCITHYSQLMCPFSVMHSLSVNLKGKILVHFFPYHFSFKVMKENLCPFFFPEEKKNAQGQDVVALCWDFAKSTVCINHLSAAWRISGLHSKEQYTEGLNISAFHWVFFFMLGKMSCWGVGVSS